MHKVGFMLFTGDISVGHVIGLIVKCGKQDVSKVY